MTIEDKIRTYVDKLKGQTGFFVQDAKTVEFFAKNPANVTPEEIRLKVGMVSDRDLDQAGAVEDMITHIQQLKIDSKLKAGDMDVVEEISRLKTGDKENRFLRFASLYCNFHRPEVYPIYSAEHMDLYKEYIDKHKLPVKIEDMKQYSVFKKVLDDVMSRHKLNELLNYQEARKLGWLYVDRIVREG